MAAAPLVVHYLKTYKITFDLELRPVGVRGLAWAREVIDALEHQSTLRVEELRFTKNGARVTALVDQDATEAEILGAIATIRKELLEARTDHVLRHLVDPVEPDPVTDSSGEVVAMGERRPVTGNGGEVVGTIGPDGPTVLA
jgi:hypothetical protein